MQLSELIETAASNRPFGLPDVEAVAQELRVSVSDLLDLFARTVAIRYLRSECSFHFADMAMNELFHPAFVGSDLGIPELAWQVFCAFYAGEYLHEGLSAHEQGEALTRKLLGRIAPLSGA